MGRGSEKTSFLRRQTDGQQVHEKVLNIIHHQGDASQNDRDISHLPERL